MKGFRFRGLLNHLAGKVFITSLPVILATGVLFWCPFIERIKQQRFKSSISQVEAQAELINGALVYGMLKNERDGIEQTVRSITKAENFLWIRIVDTSGRVHFSSRSGEIGRFVNRESDAPGGMTWYTGSMKGRLALYLFKPILNRGACSTAPCHFHPKGQKILGKIELGYSLTPW